jgi:hypothetical protein
LIFATRSSARLSSEGWSVLRPEVVRRRLEKAGEYFAVLERLRQCSLEEFLADPERQGSAERFLQPQFRISNAAHPSERQSS